MALCNISILVSDDDLTCKYLLIGLPFLQHLRIDSRTLLENNRSILDGMDFAIVGNPTETGIGQVCRLMAALATQVKGISYEHCKEYPHRSSQPACDYAEVHNDDARNEPDLFPDHSLFDPFEKFQTDSVRGAVADMLKWPRTMVYSRSHGTPFQSW